ncbi:MAG: hypothetical protein H0V64_01845 [Geodermatophilaceae bacterium]|nr:hypothetical protein [Geodermatophilaceae bacterium]
MLRTAVLRGLGLANDGPVSVTVGDADGERTADLEPIPFDTYTDWAGDYGMLRLPERADTRYLADNDAVLRYDTVPGGVYIRYLEVRRPTPDVLAALRPIVAGDGVQRVILDIRQNPGGDNHNIPALTQLLAHFRFHHPEGDVVVITDRVTFSAAANLATDLEALFDPG